MQGKKLEIKKGDKFYGLTIIHEIKGLRLRHFLCRCKCGNDKKIRLSNLTSGQTKTCGCETPGVRRPLARSGKKRWGSF